MPDLSQTDLTQEIQDQLELFQKGTEHVKLLRAAMAGKGIHAFNRERRLDLVDSFRIEMPKHKVVKFVPASGAATRMFRKIYTWVAAPPSNRKEINKFFKEISRFAFFEEWASCAEARGIDSYEGGLDPKVKWLNLLLESGLGYAQMPKGLIPFHFSDKLETPVEAHLTEAINYCNGIDGPEVHFTINQKHEPQFKAMVDAFNAELPDLKVRASYSYQDAATDTIAVLSNGDPLVDADGQMVMRPGGHGALIHNLNKIEADVVFIKNVDNMGHPRLMSETVRSKELIGGTLLDLRRELKALNKQVSKGLVDAVTIDQVRDKWNLRVPRDYLKLKEYLRRPIRVCGMVKNEGEPGGGPFWCLDKFTGESLQIIEQTQVDISQMRQEMILNSATHFNPVDLVCAIRDLDGNKIDLLEFVNHDQYFITEKSAGEQKIKALEWPGLWNGAMANWITVFVEVPSSTFNPVKELEDLLRPAHLANWEA
jgi:hypothetical protein